MNRRALQYFVKLAELQHFSKAAEACFVSQPTLSTQIMKLEEELGVALVERIPRKVKLTTVGEDIAQRARHVLRDIEQIRQTALRSRDPETGLLRIHYDRYHDTVSEFLNQVLHVQFDGDYEEAESFVTRWNYWEDKLHGQLAKNIDANSDYQYSMVRYRALDGP